jgi:RND family efflux transporter MFP subunit
LDARELTANRARAAAASASAEEAARAAAANVRAADAAVALARTTYERTRSLQEKRSATTQELDQATAARDAADAQQQAAHAQAAAADAARDAARSALEAATVTTSYAVLTAPFDGIVTERSVDPGSMANPGATLLTLEDPSAFRLEIPVDEARTRHIAVGQTADVSIGDADGWIPARVSEVARLDPSAHSFVVKLDLPRGATLRSGLFGRARFTGTSHQALTIPATAAIRRGQLTFVLTVDRDRRARLQPISLGAATGDRAEVLAGLHDGDRVIVSPPASLADGMRVSGDQP